MVVHALVKKLEGLKALDPVAKVVSGVVNSAVGPDPVKNLVHGAWLGHPAHPLLTDLPIGAWVSATVLDLTGASAQGADALVALGIATAVPTAVTGLADWADYNDDRVQRVGVVHAAANLVGLACQVASLGARRQGRRGRGVLLSLVGLGAVGAGGYLGGHLAYGLASGVDHTASDEGPQDWVDVLAVQTVDDGRPHAAKAGGVEAVVVKDGGTVRALADRCNHMGGPLHEGEVVDGCIRCPWHGSTFRLSDGAVTRAPAAAPQPCFAVRVTGERVQIGAGDGSQAT